MMVPVALLLLGALTAVAGPRLLAPDWTDREPVVALWVWQCVVAAVLLCCALSMTLSAAAAWQAARGHLFATAPSGVAEAYPLAATGPWAATTAVALACAGLWKRGDAGPRDRRSQGQAPPTAGRTAAPGTAVARRGEFRRPPGGP